MAIEFNYKNSDIIEGVIIVTPSVFEENRGAIWTSYNKDLDSLLPEELIFKHDKFSISNKNVLRGIHGDSKSWKLVSCVDGNIMQVVVDMRKDSSSYLQWEGFELGSNNHQMVLIPPGIGNAFYVNSEKATYHYKLAYHGEYVDADEQFTVPWDDPRINIEWPSRSPILSDRDRR